MTQNSRLTSMQKNPLSYLKIAHLFHAQQKFILPSGLGKLEYKVITTQFSLHKTVVENQVNGNLGNHFTKASTFVCIDLVNMNSFRDILCVDLSAIILHFSGRLLILIIWDKITVLT